ncbi:MAG: D-alanine--D-alanine ligase [Chloroflexi bacterium]|nr:D-alanine--D-alanine ligase [Chloroflexota bacterium]
MKDKIAVLMGGRSLEREVSLKSGQRVADALEERGYPVLRLDVDEHLVGNLQDEKPSLAYIALHGKYGEDGTVQEILEILNVPYTGPGVYASALGFDKSLSKEIFRSNGIPTPEFLTLSAGSFREMGAAGLLSDVVERLGLPIVVKPAGQGSALGIKIAHNADELPGALIGALSYDDKVVLERYIRGVEVAVSIVGDPEPEALPVVEIEKTKEFFDFESMYTMGTTSYHVPARVSSELMAVAQTTAVQVHKALGCRDVSRVDIIIQGDVPYVLELNTSPGMTETSLLPMAAGAAGLGFGDLVEKLVGFALRRAAV